MSQRKIKVKPGKTQSKAGFIVGIAFCIIGVVFVIPRAGAFGLLWTGVALLITLMNYWNGFSEEGVTSHEIIIDESDLAADRDLNVSDNSQGAESTDEDIEAKLKKLHSLYEQRLITLSEYEAKRKELLERF